MMCERMRKQINNVKVSSCCGPLSQAAFEGLSVVLASTPRTATRCPLTARSSGRQPAALKSLWLRAC